MKNLKIIILVLVLVSGMINFSEIESGTKIGTKKFGEPCSFSGECEGDLKCNQGICWNISV